jgi:uncharacterized repeat protein (TIGR04076 family)
MKRRNFLTKSGAVSTVALVRNASADNATRYEPHEKYRCKITVLRKDFNADFYQQHPYGEAKSCGRFEVGQEFVTPNPWDPPDGFCLWAWADLRSIIHRIHAGNPTVMIGCCTDGLRPVFFRLEGVEI